MASSAQLPNPLRRVLVANRGEIATRILTACRELGIDTVATYTDDDFGHTRWAGRAVRLSSPAAYMSVEELVRVAVESGADGVHPGYGFLSESAELVQGMAKAGVRVVGPGEEVLRATGDKVQARELAEECGVPVLPGCVVRGGEGEVAGEVKRFVEGGCGLPVMIKAVDGGGGRGIRLVRRMEELEGAVRRAVQESPSRRVFAEKAAVDGFRHVEVQIVGDGSGGVLHVWERECSIQRRYQKIVELAPSTCADRAAVQPVIAAAVRIARRVRYGSLGTFEFLLRPESGDFYFLEINPRLQVEHTVTEAAYGVDLVQAQLLLAQGARLADCGLPPSPELSPNAEEPPPPPKQYSIQLRVTAEDPEKQYALSIGRIAAFHFPSGPSVRVDTALVASAPALVSSDFDSVLAKIILSAPSWPAVVAKAHRALHDTSISGVRTNLALLRAIVAHPDFAAGSCDTQWLEANHQDLLSRSRQFPDVRDPLHGLAKQSASTSSAAAAAASTASSSSGPLFRKDDAWTISLASQGSSSSASTHHLQLTRILQNDFPSSFSSEILYTFPDDPRGPKPFTLRLEATRSSGSEATAASRHRTADASDPTHVAVPLAGKLVEVLVDPDDRVERDAPLCVVRQMKMEVEVRSPRAGRVAWVVEAEEGDDVAEGTLAAVVVDDDDDEDAAAADHAGRDRAKL